MDAKYEEAAQEFTALENQYPQDVMVKRYKGLALDKLDRFEEAIETFRAGLQVVPTNIALHYTLAQSLFHNKDIKGSIDELKYVSENDQKGDYKAKADK